MPLTVEAGPLLPGDFAARAVDAEGRPARVLWERRPNALSIFYSLRPLTSAAPYTQKFTLNDWVLLRRPGRYTVTVTPYHVLRGHDRRHWGTPLRLQSAPLTLEVTAPRRPQKRQVGFLPLRSGLALQSVVAQPRERFRTRHSDYFRRLPPSIALACAEKVSCRRMTGNW